MTPLLDTSVIVRYLTGDPPDMAEASAAVIDGDDDLAITDVVLAETAYVLASVYGVGREAIVDVVVELLQRENIEVFRLHKEAVLQALLMCRPSGRVSFADAMLWAAARSAGSTAVYSFDQRFPAEGIEVIRLPFGGVR